MFLVSGGKWRARRLDSRHLPRASPRDLGGSASARMRPGVSGRSSQRWMFQTNSSSLETFIKSDMSTATRTLQFLIANVLFRCETTEGWKQGVYSLSQQILKISVAYSTFFSVTNEGDLSYSRYRKAMSSSSRTLMIKSLCFTHKL